MWKRFAKREGERGCCSLMLASYREQAHSTLPSYLPAQAAVAKIYVQRSAM